MFGSSIIKSSLEVQLAAVEFNGLNIQYFKNPSEEVKFAAVEQNIGVLKHTSQEFKEFFKEF